MNLHVAYKENSMRCMISIIFFSFQDILMSFVLCSDKTRGMCDADWEFPLWELRDCWNHYASVSLSIVIIK